MAIRKRGKGRWQVRVRPFPEVTVPTKEAAETLELDLRLRAKLGHLYREKPTRLGDELDGLLQRKTTMGGKRGPLRPAGVRYYQECVSPLGAAPHTPDPRASAQAGRRPRRCPRGCGADGSTQRAAGSQGRASAPLSRAANRSTSAS